MIVNVSTPKSLPTNVICFTLLREQYDLTKRFQKKYLANSYSKVLRLTTEDGDIYYNKNHQGKAVHTFGHVYKAKELNSDLEYSGFKILEQGVMSIDQPYIL
ncbi:MAG: hypothetical protein SFT93_04575 [Rickettsiaceae bacterium]|nr:hypothetical protein [Rickettsiaceae bacterium]